MIKKTLLFIFHAHVPYIRQSDENEPLEAAQLYEMLSYGLLPFLRMCRRLDSDAVSLKCALVISPLLCEMLKSSLWQERYGVYLDRHIAFAQQELKRTSGTAREDIARMYLEFLTLNREDFHTRYKKDILSGINFFVAKGCIELLAICRKRLPHRLNKASVVFGRILRRCLQGFGFRQWDMIRD